MRRLVYLNSEMAKYGFKPQGSYWDNHIISSTKSLKHSYCDGEGNECEVVEICPKGNDCSVNEIRFRLNKQNIAVKSYKQMFRYLNERMLAKIMNA